MEAIILAGGLGTRLREVINDLPKPMAPVNGRPFLHYILSWLAGFPVTKIIMATGHRSEAISCHFGKTFDNMPLEYSVEKTPLGTGGAIKKALLQTSEDNIIVINGDTYFPVDIRRLYDFHNKNRQFLTIALKKMTDFDRYGSVICRGNTIVEFREKMRLSEGLINGGIYVVNKRLLPSLPEVFSFEREVLEKEAGSSGLAGIVFDDDFIDIGIPEDYYRAGIVLPDHAEGRKQGK